MRARRGSGIRNRPPRLDASSAGHADARGRGGRARARERGHPETHRSQSARLPLAVVGFEPSFGRSAAATRLRVRQQHDGRRLHALPGTTRRLDRAGAACPLRSGNRSDRDADQLDARRFPALRVHSHPDLDPAGQYERQQRARQLDRRLPLPRPQPRMGRDHLYVPSVRDRTRTPHGHAREAAGDAAGTRCAVHDRRGGRSGIPAAQELLTALVVVSLDGVSKRYGNRVALETLTIDFGEGRTTVLVGPSGCGKSTILRMIVGLITPETGTVRIAGETLTATNVERIRHSIGYVIQEGGLFPHLTAADNVTLLARHLGTAADRVTERVASLAALVRIPPEALARYPQQLSGGQRQRIGIMRALMLDPPLLLLDEPLGALDPVTRYELQTDLKGIFEQLGKTVVLVTHDMAE